jgi:hypothetical protein
MLCLLLTAALIVDLPLVRRFWAVWLLPGV